MEAVHKVNNPVTHNVLHAFTQLGTHGAIGTVAGLTAVMMIRRGRKHDAWTVVVSTGGAMAINTILKNIFRRQRPQEMARRIKLPRSHSFPSGHSLLSAATYPIVAHHLVERQSGPVQVVAHSAAAMLVLSVGFSRIYFGVHFPSDVLGGSRLSRTQPPKSPTATTDPDARTSAPTNSFRKTTCHQLRLSAPISLSSKNCTRSSAAIRRA
jgi:undecaprenyl-diphosphatase